MLESFKTAFSRSAPIILAMLIASLIVWPVLDLAFALYLTHTAFHYSVALHVIRPVLFIGAFALVTIITNMFTQNIDSAEDRK